MNIKFNLPIVFSILLSYNSIAQSWPIHQADDPDHFHRAIDINIGGKWRSISNWKRQSVREAKVYKS